VRERTLQELLLSETAASVLAPFAGSIPSPNSNVRPPDGQGDQSPERRGSAVLLRRETDLSLHAEPKPQCPPQRTPKDQETDHQQYQ